MKRGYLVAIIVLAILSLLSLALNGVVIFALLQARENAYRLVHDTQAVVTRIADERFFYDVQLDQEIPISAEIPFHESFNVPINTVVPIDTTVVVPVDLGFTTYRLTVPIETVFPVDLELTVPISEVVEVNTIVPINIEIPIDIALSETRLADYLDDLDGTLSRTEEALEYPFFRLD